MFKRKKQLEMTLQEIPGHPDPRAELEQYQTPSIIAADLLWNAAAIGDIEGFKVVDLGCGTGIFTLGSALMGAAESVGVDVDPGALKVAESYASKMGLENVVRFVESDVMNFSEPADTVIQNPPFGAQKAHAKEADRIFMEKAAQTAPVVYSFHMKETEHFVEKFFNSLGMEATHRFYYSFPIPRIYDFHQKEKVHVKVVVLRVQRKD